MTWMAIWFWWLFMVAASFGVLELYSIYRAHRAKQQDWATWTLSDTVRRWSALHRWLAPLAVGTMAMLCVHWFAQSN